MHNLKNIAIHWYFNEFQKSQQYHDMENTFEDSPYHRERSVATHTDMVVTQYISASENTWYEDILIGFFACVFHDVGKPSAEIVKHSEKRGEFRAYHGHEKLSARLWETWACENATMLDERFEITKRSIFYIGWMIEHHVPWAIKKSEKIRNLALTVNAINGRTGGWMSFTRMLLADSSGRISDDYEEKLFNAYKWCNEFSIAFNDAVNGEDIKRISYPNSSVDNENQPRIYVAIGASGSGKSTICEKLSNAKPNLEIFSLDKNRIDWYTTEEERTANIEKAYEKAYQRAKADDKFMLKSHSEFIDLIKDGKDVFLDNTNTSTKRRAFYITEARKRGYVIEGLIFLNSINTIIERQETRPDKTVNIPAVRMQYMQTQYPSYGEFDSISVF